MGRSRPTPPSAIGPLLQQLIALPHRCYSIKTPVLPQLGISFTRSKSSRDKGGPGHGASTLPPRLFHASAPSAGPFLLSTLAGVVSFHLCMCVPTRTFYKAKSIGWIT
ncbi:hypothetical protein BO78DRAFT_207810 [Aspergillus sclerotiicarbonarius CBS 121057]|uniref:Uncharacterized protein n=1 Tax=Aspergillus sclerotiicarbonarius (strain CBS 121057 / IBT 28362) TaxID=1448318 RepID=A0A319EH81_ASPSB|nr:hypothetical protein BO78DRAFT_207810 [Aspergillus sclerotiicarbonarius CBS 121057]